MARAIIYRSYGGPEVLELARVADPEPGPGEIVVDLRACGVNPRDWKERAGLRDAAPIDTPRRIGLDGAGTVSSVGHDVTTYKVGDRVALTGVTGCYADRVVARISDAAPLPSGVSFDAGAALGIPAGTAYQVLVSMGVGVGMTVLVHGIAGSVGRALAQFVRRRFGAHLIGTAGPASAPDLRALGVACVPYGPGLLERVTPLAPGGVDVALDLVGTDEAIAVSQALVTDSQRIATICRGADAHALGIRAFSGGSPIALSSAEVALRRTGLATALTLLSEGSFTVQMGPRFPLEGAANAHKMSETGHPGGKLILVP